MCLCRVAALERKVAYDGIEDETTKLTWGVKGVRKVVNKLAIRD